MKKLSLSSVLLFPLVIYFIMQYGIGPGDTPYWLFGIIFALLTGYLVIDIIPIQQALYNMLKHSLLWAVIIVVLGAAFSATIIMRHITAPVYGVHDIILQQEAAIRFFIHGTNPYATDYFHTPMAAWHYSDTEVNPALYHFVMEPFYLLFALPFYVISNHTIGYFDGRIPLLFLFILLLITAFFVPKDDEDKRTFITLLAFNPATLGYALEGRSDIYMFAFIFLGLFLLYKKHIFWAGVPIALAFMIKQSIWPFFPLYVFYIFLCALKEKKTFISSVLLTLKNLLAFFVTCAILFLPFYLWNSKAFLDSTIFYLVGNSPHSYPISGYGFGMILHQMGIIKNVHDYYSFTTLQVLLGIPLLFVLLWYMYKKPTIPKLIFSYGIFLFFFWYFSRYFNNSHLGYLSMVFLTAYFWKETDLA